MFEDAAVDRFLEAQGEVAAILARGAGMERADGTDPQRNIAIADGFQRVGFQIAALVREVRNPDFGGCARADALAVQYCCHRHSHVRAQPDPSIQYAAAVHARSEEHTSELQSLMRISSAVFCLKKKKKTST